MAAIISNEAIETIFEILRDVFPSPIVIGVLESLVIDEKFASFPETKGYKEKLNTEGRPLVRIPNNVIEEITTYFSEKQTSFIDYVRDLISSSLENNIIGRSKIDAFINTINPILISDSSIKLENYGEFRRLLKARSGGETDLNVDVPEYICDYLLEGLDCFSYQMFRSSILLSIIALEGSLRHKYSELESRNKAYKIKFDKIIDWGLEKGLIEENEFNRTNITFIRKYRNELVHFNRNVQNRSGQSKTPEQMAQIVLDLVKFFIDNIFFSA